MIIVYKTLNLTFPPPPWSDTGPDWGSEGKQCYVLFILQIIYYGMKEGTVKRCVTSQHHAHICVIISHKLLLPGLWVQWESAELLHPHVALSCL